MVMGLSDCMNTHTMLDLILWWFFVMINYDELVLFFTLHYALFDQYNLVNSFFGLFSGLIEVMGMKGNIEGGELRRIPIGT